MPTVNGSAVFALINPRLILLNNEPPYGGSFTRDTTSRSYFINAFSYG
jgi:hypothetical protein